MVRCQNDDSENRGRFRVRTYRVRTYECCTAKRLKLTRGRTFLIRLLSEKLLFVVLSFAVNK